MKVYHNISEFKRVANAVVTIGTFDGVHAGHQKIINRLLESTVPHHLVTSSPHHESVLLTFHPHPRLVLYPNQHDLQLLNTLEEKIALLERCGVEHLVIHPFTKEFSQLTHADFVKQILVDGLGVKKLIIGYDHHFGHNRSGGLRELREIAPQYNFEVEEIPEQDIDAVAISSTRIRKALQTGDVAEANILLGHDYSLSGVVVKGNQLGRTLGFPTANIQVDDKYKLIPPNGIYAVQVALSDAKESINGYNVVVYNGALSIGTRPTFDNGARTIEANIFDFDADIYGKPITLFFKHHLRAELKFESAEALVVQMKKDKLRCIELLS